MSGWPLDQANRSGPGSTIEDSPWWERSYHGSATPCLFRRLPTVAAAIDLITPTRTNGTSTAVPVPPLFSPTRIKAFTQCPERYLRRYHVGPRRREPFSRPLVRGNALHTVMATRARRHRDGTAPVSLDADVARALPRSLYPPDEADGYDDDATTVQQQAAWGMTEFDRRYGGATVLLIEENLPYQHRPGNGTAFGVETRLDLLVLHEGGTIESADWKTGSFEIDTVQNLITRAVVGRNAMRLVTGRRFAGNDAIATSAIYVGEQQTWSHVYTREEMGEEWRTLTGTIERIIAGTESPVVGTPPWLPARSWLCGTCPFQDVCSANTVTVEDLAMTAWLLAGD